jgi:hypothetical protein
VGLNKNLMTAAHPGQPSRDEFLYCAAAYSNSGVGDCATSYSLLRSMHMAHSDFVERVSWIMSSYVEEPLETMVAID